MELTRVWAMPNKNTFLIQPIKEIVEKHCQSLSVDPFANKSTIADITNDINPEYATNHNLDALDFLKMFQCKSVSTVLFDPPYSPRQVSESYKANGMAVNMETTQSSFWGNLKSEIFRIVQHGGKCITCGWNSGGIGKKYGFEIIEILLVAHGGWHNDTIVTVEQKTAKDKS